MTSIYMGPPLREQLDHDEPSYQRALAKMRTADHGAAAHPDGIITPFGCKPICPASSAYLPDPPGAQRRAPGARPRGRPRKDKSVPRTSEPSGIAKATQPPRVVGPKPGTLTAKVVAEVAALGRPATSDEINPDGTVERENAIKHARNIGYLVSRVMVIRGSCAYRRAYYAIPGMAWPDLAPGDTWMLPVQKTGKGRIRPRHATG